MSSFVHLVSRKPGGNPSSLSIKDESMILLCLGWKKMDCFIPHPPIERMRNLFPLTRGWGYFFYCSLWLHFSRSWAHYTLCLVAHHPPLSLSRQDGSHYLIKPPDWRKMALQLLPPYITWIKYVPKIKFSYIPMNNTAASIVQFTFHRFHKEIV